MKPESPAVPKHFAKLLTLGLLAALIGYAGWRIVGPYVEPLVAGAVLAVLFSPLYHRLERELRTPSVAALVSTVLMIVVVVLPLVFAVTTLVRQLREAPDLLDATSRMWPTIDRFAERFGFAPGALETMARARLQDLGAAILRGTVFAASATGSGVIKFVVAMGAFHYCLLHGRWLEKETLANSPLGRERTATLLDTVHEMIRASFYGVVAVAAAQGLLLGIGAWIAGLPIPILWGIAGAFVSVLPLVGSALVWVPGSIVLFAQGRVGMGIFFLIWSAVLVANADNVVRPMIVMQSLPVSGLLVFIAILGGIQAFGLIGIVAGPVTLAVGIALLKILREELQNAENGE